MKTTYITQINHFLKIVIYAPRQKNFRFLCIPEPFYDFSPFATFIVETSYYFYLLKVVDLLDTIFFILRKKTGQVSFLHIYHHSGMALIAYLYFKLYSGGGYATVLGKTNQISLNIRRQPLADYILYA